MNDGKYIIRKNGKIIDVRDNIDGPALWRRVSSDDCYIVEESGDGFFLHGTQSEDLVVKLLGYLNNLSSSDLHPEQNRRIQRYPYRELGVRIVPRSAGNFLKIKNRHMFTDRHRVAYMERYKC